MDFTLFGPPLLSHAPSVIWVLYQLYTSQLHEIHSKAEARAMVLSPGCRTIPVARVAQDQSILRCAETVKIVKREV